MQGQTRVSGLALSAAEGYILFETLAERTW
jgi:hypothetical protein